MKKSTDDFLRLLPACFKKNVFCQKNSLEGLLHVMFWLN